MGQRASRLADDGSRIKRTLYGPPLAQTLPQLCRRGPFNNVLDFLQQIV
jgi:hypothetical protein